MEKKIAPQTTGPWQIGFADGRKVPAYVPRYQHTRYFIWYAAAWKKQEGRRGRRRRRVRPPARPFGIMARSPAYVAVEEMAGLPDGERVVLLHGWLQSREMWRSTAKSLAAAWGCRVLLVDLPAHGQASQLPRLAMHTPDALVAVLRGALERAGWADAPLTMAGASMGGALAVRYALLHPGSVRHLLLVAPAGRSELGRASIAPAGAGALALTGWMARFFEGIGATLPSPLRRLAAQAQLGGHSPRFGLPADAGERLRRRGTTLAIAWGLWDVVHTPQIGAWAGRRSVAKVPSRGTVPRPEDGEAARPSGRDEDLVWVWTSAWRGHETLCGLLGSAHLERHPELWGLGVRRRRARL